MRKNHVISLAMILLLTLTGISAAQDIWPNSPLLLPQSSYGFSIQVYEFQLGDRPEYRTNCADLGFSVNTALIDRWGPIPDEFPFIYPEDIYNEFAITQAGSGLFHSHGVNGVGIAVTTFNKTDEGLCNLTDLYGWYLRDPYWSDKVFAGTTGDERYPSGDDTYFIGIKWAALKSMANFREAIIHMQSCFAANGLQSIGGFSSALAVVGPYNNCLVTDSETNVQVFWDGLARKSDHWWVGYLYGECPNLRKISGENFSTLVPGVKVSDDPMPSIWVPVGGVSETQTVTFDSFIDTNSPANMAIQSSYPIILYQANWGMNQGSFYQFPSLDYSLMAWPGVTDGNIEVTLRVDGVHNINAPNLHVQEGNFSVAAYISSNPGANVLGFEVNGGVGNFKVGGEYDVVEYIIRGSDSDRGPWTEVTRIPATGASEYTFSAAEFAYYNLQHREVGVGGEVIRTHDTVPAGLWMSLNTVTVPSEDELNSILADTKQMMVERDHRPENPVGNKSLPALTVHVMCPQRWMGAVDYYRWLWETDFQQDVSVELHATDGFWAGTQDSDVFLQNEKAFMQSLPHSGPVLFVFVGSAMLEKEFNSVWPTENGWRNLQLSYQSSGYVADHALNVHPTPSWSDSRAQRVGHGGFGPYGYSDWLQVDFDNDGWPDPDYAVCRLPFEGETPSGLLFYIEKVMRYQSGEFTTTPFPTVQWMVGDLNHQNDYDSLEAIDIADGLQQKFDQWTDSPTHPPVLESAYPSDVARSQKTLQVLQENWASIIAGTSTTSNRYKLGNFFLEQYLNPGELTSWESSYPILSMFTCDFAHYGWPRSTWLGTPFNQDLLGVYHDGPIAFVGPNDWSHQLANGEFSELFYEEVNSGERLAFAVANALQRYRALHPNDEYRLKNALKTTVLGCGAIVPRVRVDNLSGVGDAPSASLAASNYPNPFNPVTTIKYHVPRQGHMQLRIYDARGSLVSTVVDEVRSAGHHEASWEGLDDNGRPVASGVYLYVLKSESSTVSQKMTLVK